MSSILTRRFVKTYVNDILGGLVILISALAIIGWFAGIQALYQLQDGWITTKPWAAASCILAGCHIWLRSIMYRTSCRGTMLNALGLSYACAVLLFMWESTFLFVQLFQNNAPMIDTRSMDSLTPSIITISAMLCYSITGFCTRHSWTVATVLSFLGLWSFAGYAIHFFGVYYIEVLSINVATCFTLLGAGIFINRSQRTHWFVTECKEIFRDFTI